MTISAARRLVRCDRIPDGGFVGVEVDIGGSLESLVLYRLGPAVRAWFNVCPHAGRRLDWAPGQFLKSREGLLVCAVHGAAFELEGGTCSSGPCRGQALQAVRVRVVGADVVLE